MTHKSSKVISKAINKRRFERKLRTNIRQTQLNAIATLLTLPPQLTNDPTIYGFFYGY
jgi:hypothetical protein